MFNKYSIFLAIVTAIVVAANVIPPSAIPKRATAANVTYVGNNLYIGKRTRDDWLGKTNVVYAAAIPSRIVTRTLSIVTYFNLTYVEAVVSGTNRSAAYPTLVSGGPGQRNTTLRFTSKAGQPINATVRAYVRY